MHTKKKHTPPKAAAIRLTLLLFPMHVHKTTRPLPKFRAAKPTQQIAIREQIELHPSQRDSPPHAKSHIY